MYDFMILLMYPRIDDISSEDERSLEQEAVSRAAETRAAETRAAETRPATQSPPVQSTGSFPPGLGVPLAVQLPTPAEAAAQTTEEYMVICRAFIEQLRSGSAPWLLQRLNNMYGTMPTDPSEFSYWMALVGYKLSGKVALIATGDPDRRV